MQAQAHHNDLLEPLSNGKKGFRKQQKPQRHKLFSFFDSVATAIETKQVTPKEFEPLQLIAGENPKFGSNDFYSSGERIALKSKPRDVDEYLKDELIDEQSSFSKLRKICIERGFVIEHSMRETTQIATQKGYRFTLIIRVKK